jgi:hypothetical protein
MSQKAQTIGELVGQARSSGGGSSRAEAITELRSILQSNSAARGTGTSQSNSRSSAAELTPPEHRPETEDSDGGEHHDYDDDSSHQTSSTGLGTGSKFSKEDRKTLINKLIEKKRLSGGNTPGKHQDHNMTADGGSMEQAYHEEPAGGHVLRARGFGSVDETVSSVVGSDQVSPDSLASFLIECWYYS